MISIKIIKYAAHVRIASGDIAEVRIQEGKLCLFVAIDRTSKFAFVELHEQATRIAGDFLRALATAVPYKIHIVLTDNGTHFTDPTDDGWTPEDIKAMRAKKVPFRVITQGVRSVAVWRWRGADARCSRHLLPRADFADSLVR